MERLEISGIELFRGSLQEYRSADKSGRLFNGILLDAPCSGLGVIRRHPEIRWNRKPEDLAAYQRQQLELLNLATGLLGAGGVLVYATCSTEPEENEEVVQRYLAAQPQMLLENGAQRLPAAARCLVNDKGYFRTMPGQIELDGFFGAVLRRKDLS